MQSKGNETFDTTELYNMLNLFYLNIILRLRLHENMFSCACVFNIWFTETEEESMTDLVCKFPVFQTMASS